MGVCHSVFNAVGPHAVDLNLDAGAGSSFDLRFMPGLNLVVSIGYAEYMIRVVVAVYMDRFARVVLDLRVCIPHFHDLLGGDMDGGKGGLGLKEAVFLSQK